MFSNYLRIALRTLGKNKVYSSINISGFAIGIACSLLILLWVYDELTYDTYLPKYDRIFRLMVKSQYGGSVNIWNANSFPSAAAVKDDHSSVVNVAVTDWGGSHLLADASKGDRTGIRKNGNYATESFLEIFEHPMIAGNPSTALQGINSIVLTESTARSLFGSTDVLDRSVRLDDQHELKVTGLIHDVPANSNITFDFLVPWKLYEKVPWIKMAVERWDFSSFPIYVELKDKTDEPAVEAKIKDLLARNGQTEYKQEPFLHPISRWRLHSQFENGVEAGGMITYVRLFSIIAGFILFIACVNFMNLATARAEKRAVEVGVRKSVGSRRFDLISQFIGESVVTTTIAFIAGLILAQVALPFYNQLVSKQLSIPYNAWQFWTGCLIMVVFTGIIAGSYPAFYLSAFKPAKVLKGGRGGVGGTLPRKILVTMQFGFSMLLIAATIVVYQQIQHVRDRDLGYKPDNLLSVGVTSDIIKNYKSIKESLLATGAVEAVTRSNSSITSQDSWNPVDWPGKPLDEKYFFALIATEYDYVKTTGIKLLEGRDFSQDFKSDSAACIVNRAAIELMNMKDPIGAKVTMGQKQYEIIGVAENTLSGSPYDPIGPMIVTFQPDWIGTVMVRLSSSLPVADALKKVEAVFRTYSPAYPFDYRFSDDAFQQKFTNINLTSRLASIFAMLTIIITGLGLFGLAAFMADQRTKEMGIRKVMGASVQQLVRLVTSDFTVLIAIAFVLSSPLAWWLMTKYLEQYSYRVDVQWWIFPLTGVVALIFALVIVSTQALKAARTNPARSLRSE
ncbi:MAG TPA: ABC transporter permease [Cyclobacteriaceae bacterium]|nr:ABC transporter permease [Cyclobacteriaceae bacterium]